MRIGFATSDWAHGAPDANGYPTLGGAGWYRIGLPAKYLAVNDHTTVVGTLIGNRKTGEFGIRTWDGEHHWDFNVIVCQRWMLEGLPADTMRARAYGQIIVNDIDDWFWGLHPNNNAFRHSHPKFNKIENRDHYVKVLSASSLITVSTPYLAERLQKMLNRHTEIVVVRNAIDLERWHAHPVDREPCTVGWVGALPWRSGDLETLTGIVKQTLGDRHRFHHSGHVENFPYASDVLRLDRDQWTAQGMAPIDTYPVLFEPIDVGVVPLSDRPFNHAKSAIKGMEYAAAGIPFVAAATPEYEWLSAHHGIGYVARRPKDWIRLLHRLIDDPDRRTTEAEHNRMELADLDFADRWVDWLHAYESALGYASTHA